MGLRLAKLGRKLSDRPKPRLLTPPNALIFRTFIKTGDANARSQRSQLNWVFEDPVVRICKGLVAPKTVDTFPQKNQSSVLATDARSPSLSPEGPRPHLGVNIQHTLALLTEAPPPRGGDGTEGYPAWRRETTGRDVFIIHQERPAHRRRFLFVRETCRDQTRGGTSVSARLRSHPRSSVALYLDTAAEQCVPPVGTSLDLRV